MEHDEIGAFREHGVSPPASQAVKVLLQAYDRLCCAAVQVSILLLLSSPVGACEQLSLNTLDEAPVGAWPRSPSVPSGSDLEVLPSSLDDVDLVRARHSVKRRPPPGESAWWRSPRMIDHLLFDVEVGVGNRRVGLDVVVVGGDGGSDSELRPGSSRVARARTCAAMV